MPTMLYLEPQNYSTRNSNLGHRSYAILRGTKMVQLNITHLRAAQNGQIDGFNRCLYLMMRNPQEMMKMRVILDALTGQKSRGPVLRSKKGQKLLEPR
eukprot:4933100-Ditylum_brightwellii.AAC.2